MHSLTLNFVGPSFQAMVGYIPASIIYKSIAVRYPPVSYPDGPITDRYRFLKNASWDMFEHIK